MRRVSIFIFFMIIAVLTTGCSESPSTLFEPVPASVSKIGFINTIKETVDFNILNYEYFYNGGGVAVGDLNNDGLQDLVFSGNMVPCKLYLNKGNMVFEDFTVSSGFTDRKRWKTGVNISDVNGDGLADIYLCYSGPGTDEERSNQLFINKGLVHGIPSFTESAKAYGLQASGTFSTTSSFFDMDNDGDLDMFLVNHADMFYNPLVNTEKLRARRHPQFGNRLYRNDNGFFHDISTEANIYGSGLNFGLSVSTSDINMDGWTDIYVTNDYDERDFLYINNQNGTFTEVLDKAAGHISEFAMGSDIADYNNDNMADVVVLDMLPADNQRQKLLKGADTYDKYSLRVKHGFHHQQMRNTLQLNNGADSNGLPVFSEIGQLAGIDKTDWSWAPLFADFDNDGWKDLLITNGINKDITNLDFVKYTSGYSSNFIGKKGDNVELWELIQQMPSTKLNNYFYRNKGDLTFEDVSEDWVSGRKTISNGAAYSDLDNDGDLDLIINCLNDPPILLRNKITDKIHSHYLKIKLQGSGKNTSGIGAKIHIVSASGDQMYEQFTSRGFQSSVDNILHVGLGSDSIIASLTVSWPSGKVSRLTQIKANTLVFVDERLAEPGSVPVHVRNEPLLTNITESSGIRFLHKQSSFVDFKISPLLPFQLSKIGAAVAKADVNNDGMEDLFIGSNTKQENILYLQDLNGNFSEISRQPWNINKDKTIADAVFFDAEGDGDQDLYLVSGGYDYYLNAKNYQDEIYLNDGAGYFKKAEFALPAETSSGSCVTAGDYNKDGLPDIFIGGFTEYGQFPKAAESILLINRSVDGLIRFDIDFQQKDTSVYNPGMVTDAEWVDINNDGWTDLVAVGLFMPVTIFENNHGSLVNKSNEYGTEKTNGWWCRILSDDFNNDGFADLVIGNMGTNTAFKVSLEEPLTITYSDFNDDGRIDPILAGFNNGKRYPYFSRDEIFEQMPSLQKKFGRYADYANAQIEDMFDAEQLDKAQTVYIYNLNSITLLNSGNRKFIIDTLPIEAQVSMASGLLSEDLNNDHFKDILVAGNFFPMRVQMGPMDASIGLVLKNDGKGKFRSETYEKTGVLLKGDIRSLHKIKSGSNHLLLSNTSDRPIQIFNINHQNEKKYLPLK